MDKELTEASLCRNMDTTGLAFAQMSAKQGIKKYDKEAEEDTPKRM